MGFAVNRLACVSALESMGESSEQSCIFVNESVTEVFFLLKESQLALDSHSLNQTNRDIE